MADEERFDPMKELNKLRKQVNKVVEQGIQTVQTATTTSQFVRLDMYEVNDEVVIKTNALDGLDPSSIEVAMDGDELTIAGETTPQETPALASFFVQERRFGAFSRTVSVPIPVIAEEARAKLGKNGVLTVTLPVDKKRYQDITVTPAD